MLQCHNGFLTVVTFPGTIEATFQGTIEATSQEFNNWSAYLLSEQIVVRLKICL